MPVTAPHRAPPSPIRTGVVRTGGFSLIEVLIAMLVLAIGLLGLAALQAQGLKFNTDAYVRSQANVLAHDIMDRVRLNRDDADDYVDGDLAGQIAAVDLAAPSCSLTALDADNDITCWLEDLVTVLPAPTARICRQGTASCPCPAGVSGCPGTSSPDPYIDVTIGWLDREYDSSAECIAVPFHQWYTAESVCRVVQIWTFYP